MKATIVIGVALLIGCGGDVGAWPKDDSGPAEDASNDVGTTPTDASPFQDVSIPDAGPPPPPGFFLLATETPYAPASDHSNWGGVTRFDVSADYASATSAPAVPKSDPALADPLGLAFRWTSAELFVASRGGNLGSQSIISKFAYDAKTKTLGAGTVVVSGFTGFHQMTFNPKEDEIFVGTNNEGMRRFKLGSSKWTEVLPQLVGSPNWIRGVAVSADGKRLYASTAGSVIRQWDLTTNQELPMYQLADTSVQLHFMTLCGPAIGDLTVGCSPNRLYVSDSNQTGPRAVYRFDIGTNDDLTNETKIPSDPTFSTALSPDTLELFSGESYMNQIQRFKPQTSTWTPYGTPVPTNNTIGTILVFPKNAVPTQLN